MKQARQLNFCCQIVRLHTSYCFWPRRPKGRTQAFGVGDPFQQATLLWDNDNLRSCSHGLIRCGEQLSFRCGLAFHLEHWQSLNWRMRISLPNIHCSHMLRGPHETFELPSSCDLHPWSNVEHGQSISPIQSEGAIWWNATRVCVWEQFHLLVATKAQGSLPRVGWP